MSLNLRWVGDDQRERVAETRMLCYAPARKELSGYLERLHNDTRSKPGDWLLAERDGSDDGDDDHINCSGDRAPRGRRGDGASHRSRFHPR